MQLRQILAVLQKTEQVCDSAKACCQAADSAACPKAACDGAKCNKPCEKK